MSDIHARGLHLYRIGRFQSAADTFREELVSSPDSVPAHKMLALSLMMLKQLPAAFASAVEAVRLAPGESGVYYVMGIVRLRYRKLDFRDARKRRAYFKALRQSGFHPLLEARRAVHRAIEIDPNTADYFGLLTVIESLAGFWGNSLVAADRTLSLKPDHKRALAMRACALMVLGRSAEATIDMNAAIRAGPNDPAVHTARGWHMLRLGRPGAAVEHFTESLRIDPTQKGVPAAMRRARLSRRFAVYGWVYRMLLRTGRGEFRRLILLLFILPILPIMIPADLSVRLCALIGVEGYGLLSFGPLMDRRVWADPVEKQRIGRSGFAVARAAVWAGAFNLGAILFAILSDVRADVIRRPTPICWIGWAVLPWVAIPVARIIAKLFSPDQTRLSDTFPRWC